MTENEIITHRVAEVMADQIIGDSYWDLFAADEVEKDALCFDPWE